MKDQYDIIAVGAHPDDVEVFMGGTLAKLSQQGLSILMLDLCSGEPARHAAPGVRREQSLRAAELLGADRITLDFQDRYIVDSVPCRMAVADYIRRYSPRVVFTSEGCGVHPDHQAVTEVVTHAVFYARLPKWDEVADGERLADTDPHEIDRLFYGHCRMETAWDRFDFAVDVSSVYDRKLAALASYESVFSGDAAELIERYSAEDRYVGSQVGVRYAEPFKARHPVLLDNPLTVQPVPYG